MDTRAVANVSEMVSAEAKAAALQAELLKAEVLLKKWAINFDVEVEPQKNGTYSVVIVGKAGDRGFRKTIEQNDVLYHAADKFSIAQIIAVEFVAGLINDTATDALLPVLSKAFDNVIALTSSKGLSK